MELEFIAVIQAVSDGVMKGSTYALIALGYTMIFGVMQRLNLTYAAASVGGAYASLVVIAYAPDINVFVVFGASIIVSGVLGYAVYLACFRFIPLANPLATLMATIGCLFFVEELIVEATDGMPQPYPAMPYDEYFEFGMYSIRGDLVLIFLFCVIATLIFLYMLYRTRLGIATRAVAQQPVAARLAGMSIEKTNAITFIITGLLGGLAAAMVGAVVSILSPLVILPITVKGLIATVIGGLGSLPGAIVAGLMVGGFEEFFLIATSVTQRDLYVMLLLFIFLVFRPGGLFPTSAERD